MGLGVAKDILLAHPKISHLHVAVPGEHHVVELEVAVQDSLSMQEVEREHLKPKCTHDIADDIPMSIAMARVPIRGRDGGAPWRIVGHIFAHNRRGKRSKSSPSEEYDFGRVEPGPLLFEAAHLLDCEEGWARLPSP